MLGVNNECLSFTPALRNLALAEGDREHHANVAEVARDIFLLKCDRNAEARHNMQAEARAVVKESQRKITKSNRLALAFSSAAIGHGAALAASAALPIASPFVLLSAAVVGIGTFIPCSMINVQEENKKVFTYSNFPEAVRSDFIKKEAYKIIEQEEKELLELENLPSDPKYHGYDENGDKSFNHTTYQADRTIELNKIALAKLARINALHVVVKRTIYS